jgi:hypothetical protein
MKTGLPPAEWAQWDKQVRELGGGILQSHSWGQFQAALGRPVAWDQGGDWLWSGAIRASKGIKYLLCSYGPLAADSKSAATAMASLVAAGRELGVDFVRVEPQSRPTPQQLKKLGAKRIHEFNAEHTRVLDLTQSEEALRQDLASGHRNLINGTERRGITIRRETNPQGLQLLLKMLDDTARRSGVTFFDGHYFQTLLETLPLIACLYVADVDGRPVAAALAYDWGGTRYYAHAGAFQVLNRQAKASVSLVWRMILDAKAAGLQRFDLWGVAPDNAPNHRLAGVSKFKTAFGGTQINYGGTWDIPLKPLTYRAYSAYRAIRRMDK